MVETPEQPKSGDIGIGRGGAAAGRPKRATGNALVNDRIRKGVANGDLPEATDCDMLAAYYSAVARGLAVQARDGASREKLSEIGRLAMRAWPG